MHLTVSPRLIVQKIDFSDNTLELCLLNFENFPNHCNFLIHYFKKKPRELVSQQIILFILQPTDCW